MTSHSSWTPSRRCSQTTTASRSWARAGNGQDAVDLANALEPDLTLMDISMPVLDGIEAARRIRLERPTACILILTGSSISADVDRARQAGVAGFLTKDRLGTQLVDAILELGTK